MDRDVQSDGQYPSSNATAQRPNNTNLLHSKATNHSRAQLHAANEGGESGNVTSPGLGIKITHGLLTSRPKHSGESFRLVEFNLRSSTGYFIL